MCLGVPGKVVRWIDHDDLFAVAEVEFGGARRPIQMACVPDVDVGQFVIVHAGIAICRVDEVEAKHTLDQLVDFENVDDHAGDSR